MTATCTTAEQVPSITITPGAWRDTRWVGSNRRPRHHTGDRFDVADAAALPWPDGRIDLLMCSPPYALDVPYAGGNVPDYDAWLDGLRVWLAELHRVANPNWGRLCLNVPLDRDLGGWEPISADAVQIGRSAGWQFRTWIVWDKLQAAQVPIAAASTPRPPQRHRPGRVRARVLPRQLVPLGSGDHAAGRLAGALRITRALALPWHLRPAQPCIIS